MRYIIGIILMLASIAGGLYVGGWLMFIQPILDACAHFDAGTLTGAIVGATVLKCVFASAVGSAITYIGILVGRIVCGD